MTDLNDKLMPILDNCEAIKELTPPDRNKAVYLLTNNGAIQYIGQSIRPHTRIESHRAEGKIGFDKAHYIPGVDADDADMLEMTLIIVLKPQYNKYINLALADTNIMAKYGLQQLSAWSYDTLENKHRRMLLGEE